MPWLAGERLVTGLLLASVAGGPGPTDGVLVHLEVARATEGPVVLQRIEPVPSGDTAATRPAISLEPVCEAPCDQSVDLAGGSDFLVDGPAIPGSRVFSLREAGDDLTLRVRPGRRGMLSTGWTLTILGAATVAAGFLTFAFGEGDGRRVGGILAGAGAPVTGLGAILIAFGRTRVEVLPTTRQTAGRR